MKHKSYLMSTLIFLSVGFLGYAAWEWMLVAMPIIIALVSIVMFSSIAVFVPLALFTWLHGLWFVEHPPSTPARRVAAPRAQKE